MQINKIKVSTTATDRLRLLKSRTRMTPNILCRLGFCLSIKESSAPNPDGYTEDGQEFNRYTLLGEWDDLYIALLKQKMHQDGIALDQIEDQFRAHVNRGVISLSKLVKGVSDIARLVSRQQDKTSK
jgi:DNA sulfur modification protein DndE